MSDVFLAPGFSGHINYETGDIYPGYRDQLEDIIDALYDVGRFSVYCSVQENDWKASTNQDTDRIKADMNEIKLAPTFLYLPSKNGISETASAQTGIAIGMAKKVIVATRQDRALGNTFKALSDLGIINHVSFKDPEELALEVKWISENN